MDTAIQIGRALLHVNYAPTFSCNHSQKLRRIGFPNDDFAPLPEEMVIEILKLLPLESVLASERVSKPWKNLINSPDFKTAYPNKFTADFLSQCKLYGLFLKATTFANSTRDRRVYRPLPLGLHIALLGLQRKQRRRNDLPLPEDVLVKILKLLPSESVLAWKLVSKQWKNLINGAEYMEVVCRYKFTAFLHTQGNLYVLFTRTPHDITNDPRPSAFTVHRILDDIVHMLPGSSKKIACVKVNPKGAYFVSYDSLTRESYEVNDAPLRLDWRSWIGYGFGYDPRANDHKILVVCPVSLVRSLMVWFQILRYDDNIDGSVLFVYSFRKRGWKFFKGFRHAAYDWPSNEPAAAYGFNGVLHWVLCKESPRKRVLGALDLHSYKFAEIELPKAGDLKTSTTLAKLDGHLRYCAYRRKGCLDLWVMKEYGVGKSWTKLLRFWVNHRRIHVDDLTPTLLYRCGDGTRLVLFVDHFREFRLFCYDIDKDTMQAVDKTGSWMIEDNLTR